MSGYTGTVRRGFSLRDPGQGRMSLDSVSAPCPDCGRPARVEQFELNGQPAGQFVCSTWKNVRKMFKGNVQGCKPRRLSKEELEKYMQIRNQTGNYLTQNQEEQILKLMEASGLSESKLSLDCEWNRTRVNDIIRRKTKITEHDWAKIGTVTARAIQRRQREEAEAPAPPEKPLQIGTDLEHRVTGLQLAVENLRTVFVEYRDRAADQIATLVESGELVSREALRQTVQGLSETQSASAGEIWDHLNEHNKRIEVLERSEGLRGPTMIDYSRGVGEPLEVELETPETYRGQEPPGDLFRSFLNFEKICVNMRRKCPHLFEAAVKRSGEVLF